MKKTGLLLIAVLIISVLFFSCDDVASQPPESVTDATGETTETTPVSTDIELIKDGKSIYKVIRSDDSSAKVTEAMTYMRDTIKEMTGVYINIGTDWLNYKKGEKPEEYEILLGMTNRDESAKVQKEVLTEYDYIIKTVGTKIVIVGGCDAAVYRGAEYFVKNILTSEATLPSTVLYNGKCSEEDVIVRLSGETGRTVKNLYDGVVSTHYSLSKDSVYGQQEITVVEFDPKQADLYFDVEQGGQYATSVKTVRNTVIDFNKNNGEGKTAIVAINGDLWMTSAHARTEGKSYKDYSDTVVKSVLTVPRGYNVYNGEIISSAHIAQETPLEGEFYAFGITDDGKALLGQPKVKTEISDVTSGKNTLADGINRLPANNALIMYTDKISNNYSLDNAREIIIDCEYDYTVFHGAVIKGKVTSVIGPGDTKQALKPNRIILTARGNKLSELEGFSVGDEVEIKVTVTDSLGHSKEWQGINEAVGGHIPVIIDGKIQNVTNTTAYPSSVLGIKENGNVVMITYDGRQTGYAVGLKMCDLGKFCREIGVVTAFFLDGGGSATMVQKNGNDYAVIGKPSDGSPRAVVNSVILSYGVKKEK